MCSIGSNMDFLGKLQLLIRYSKNDIILSETNVIADTIIGTSINYNNNDLSYSLLALLFVLVHH